MMHPTYRWTRPLRSVAVALAAGALLGGCASYANPKDPFERFNRSMFEFNDAIDRTALKPAATAYRKVLPSFVQTGVANFFGNLTDGWSAVNNLLQFKGRDGMSDVTRFALNTTFGLGGLLDIGSEVGLQKHNEDFGQTLGHWGVPAGPYIMLPLLGPSTFRDTAAMPLDIYGDIWSHKEPAAWRNVGIGVRAVSQRAAVLDASALMEAAALDRYEFIRDSYMQRRESKINDGDGARRKKKASDDAPSDAKSIKAAYSDDPGATPAEPVKPAPSAKPAPSTAPAKPAPSAKPGAPAEPAKPAQPDAPAEPAAPPPPAVPGQSSAPVSSEPASK